MIERLIENWLTNTSERGYEVAFCQLLMAEGHTLIHRDRHTATEHGKDIITRNADGQLCGLQLKQGDIDVSRWRSEVLPEVNELVEYAVQHPSARGELCSQPMLVTSGRLNENVLGRVNTLNDANRVRGLAELSVIQGPELVGRFVGCHGRFLPSEPADFDLFLRLYLANGRDVLAVEQMVGFLEGMLDPGIAKKTDAARAIVSTTLLSSYAVAPFVRHENHFSEFEAWLLTAAHIARLAGLKELRRRDWEPSFELACAQAWASLESLAKEFLDRDMLAEGDPLWDGGPIFRSRLTIGIGAACAASLVRQMRGEDDPDKARVRELVESMGRQRFIWGESALPFFLASAWFIEQCGQGSRLRDEIARIIQLICTANAKKSAGGLVSPYHRPEACIGAACDVEELDLLTDDPRGHSYYLAPLIDMLVHRNYRQTLKSLWYGTTDIAMTEARPDVPADYFAWRADDAQLRQWFVARPTKWPELVGERSALDCAILPPQLRERPDFALMFLLVYPHRATRPLVKLIDDALIHG